MSDPLSPPPSSGPEIPPSVAAEPLDSGVVFLGDADLVEAEESYQRRLAVSASELVEPSGGETAVEDPLKGAEEGGEEERAPEPESDEASELDGRGGNDSDPDSDPETEASALRVILEWVMVLVGAVVVALVMRAYLFQAFSIPSESMEATLQVRDRVMVNRLSYHLHDVNRGDIVVFDKPEGVHSDTAHLIKRVIALEGETIEGRDNAVFVDGQRVLEPYRDPADTIFDFAPTVVPTGHVFVMGDNRDESGDSRVFGTIHTETIVGRAFFIYWPLDRLDGI